MKTQRNTHPPDTLSTPASGSRLATYCTLSIGACALVTSESQAQFVPININSAGSGNIDISAVNAGMSFNASKIQVYNFAGTGRLELYFDNGYHGFDGDNGLSFAKGSGYASPSNFSLGSPIGPSAVFSNDPYMTVFRYGNAVSPNFGAGSYMGFRFQTPGQAGSYNYGWMEVLWNYTGTRATSSFQILAAGYEATPNTTISAGIGATPVPEMSSGYPLALALGGLAVRQYRKRRQSRALSIAE